MSRVFLQEIALYIVNKYDSPFSRAEFEGLVGRPIIEIITCDWIQAFLDQCNIVTCKQCGSLARSVEHTAYTEQLIACHLCELERDFASGMLDEDVVANMDETHFLISEDNHHTLGFIGEEKVNYADVVSGGEGMTMVLLITGGPNSKIEVPFVIFKNKDSNYPIHGVPGNIEGVSCRTGPRGWMIRDVFNQWQNGPRAIQEDPNGRKRAIFIDNCLGHNETLQQVQLLQRLKAKIRFLPANATHLCQPQYSFVIQNIKSEWRSTWEEEKWRRIKNIDWADGENGSGKLRKPVKPYFMKFGVDCLAKLNNMKDGTGLSFSRKAMIRCGFSRDADRTWKAEQLFAHLQKLCTCTA